MANLSKKIKLLKNLLYYFVEFIYVHDLISCTVNAKLPSIFDNSASAGALTCNTFDVSGCFISKVSGCSKDLCSSGSSVLSSSLVSSSIDEICMGILEMMGTGIKD